MSRSIDWKRLCGIAAGLAGALVVGGCISIGQQFPVEKADQLKIGETTRAQVQQLFGNPLMTGVADGNPSWTYTRVRYSLFSGARAQVLEVEFDERGVLSSYTVNSTPDTRRGAHTGR